MKSNSFQPLLWLIVIFAITTFFAACGGDDNNNNSNNENDVRETSQNEVEETETCSTDDDCPDGNICTVNGCEEIELNPCRRPGEPCDANNLDQGDYACIKEMVDDPTGICMPKCDDSVYDEEDYIEPCPSGSFCFDFSEGAQPFDVCYSGDCTNVFTSAEDCQGGTCYPLINGASVCLPAGDAAEGQACDTTSTTPDSTCAVGLLCLGGACTAPCSVGDSSACVAPETCNELAEDFSDVGVCAETCTPFSLDECTEGKGCIPTSETKGLCTLVGTAAAGEECEPPFYYSACGPNLMCIPEESDDPTGTCTPICGPFANPGQMGSCADNGACMPASDDNLIGLCQATCYPWQEDPGCEDGQGCFENNDGTAYICVDVGTTQANETCSPPYYYSSCAAGLLCMPDGSEEEGICTALCNPGANPGDQYGNCGDAETCRGLNDTLGLCQTACEPFSIGQCPDGGCFPSSATSGTCIGVGSLDVGDTCGNPDNQDSCQENMICLIYSEEEGGECQGLCNPDGQPDDELGQCQEGADCNRLSSPHLGFCTINCDPWNTPSGCTNGEGCFPVSRNAGQCVEVGDTAIGDVCSPPGSFSACAEGGLCVADTEDDEDGTCMELCLPFNNGVQGACSGPGAACSVRTSSLGFCVDEPLGLNPGDPCTDFGVTCDDNVMCIGTGGGQGVCMHLCRVMGGENDCPDELSCVGGVFDCELDDPDCLGGCQ